MDCQGERAERSQCVLSRLFLQQVAERPTQTALKTPTEDVTFAQLHSRASKIRDALANTRTSSQVLEYTPNTNVVAIACGTAHTAEICAVLGVVLYGGCFVPIDPSLPLPRLRDVMHDAQPSAVIVTHGSTMGAETGEGGSIAAIIDASKLQGCLLHELQENGEALESGVITTPDGKNGHEENVAEAQPTCLHDGVRTEAFSNGRVSPERGYESAAGLPSAASPVVEDLLYILYTSGTTGVPKGVRGTRSGAVNRIRFGWELCPYRAAGELVARRTPFCFVDFVAEVFSPLLAGIPLFLAPAGVASDPLRLVPALTEAEVSRITLTPSLLASLLRTVPPDDAPLLPKLHTWLVSGEALHPDLVKLFSELTGPGVQLINLYGSTEVSGDATYCTMEDIFESAGARNKGVLIGKPLPSVHLSIVSPDLIPLPVGQPGELIVGGVGVALGYHNRPQESSVKFLHSTSHGAGRPRDGFVHVSGSKPGSRVVRTGDRVVQLVEGGMLFWLGKMDGEVKVRGVRVCLEEVESLACTAAGLPSGAFAVAYVPGTPDNDVDRFLTFYDKMAQVTTNAPDRGYLVGFFVPKKGRPDDTELARLKHRIAAEITAAQLPALLVPVVAGFPLTSTGKVDKRMLLQDYFKRWPNSPKIGAVHLCGVNGSMSDADVAQNAELSPTYPALDTTRVIIARAISAVLPAAGAAVTSWSNEQLSTEVSNLSSISGLTFATLGGTSLLAVEAAWLASRSASSVDVGSATAARTSLGTLLTANDFLRGTLDEVVARLGDALREDLDATIEHTTSGLAGARTTEHLALKSADIGGPKLPIGGSGSPSSMSSSVAKHSLSGHKRRFEVANAVCTGRGPSFWALGRAGTRLRHRLDCFGGPRDSVNGADRVTAVSVQFQLRWTSDLTKCIDATPLVVIPESVKASVDVRKAKSPHNTGGFDTTSLADLSSAACLCRWNPGDVSTERAWGTVPEKANGSNLASNSTFVPVDDKGDQAMVYIGSHSGEFQALNLATGLRQWSFRAGGRIEAGAACSSDGSKVFVGCHDRYMYAINRGDGTVLWRFETGDAIKCTPVCMRLRTKRDASKSLARESMTTPTEGQVLVGSHDGILRGLTEDDGRLVWSFDCGGALFASPAHDADADTCIIYAATTRGRVLAIACLCSDRPGATYFARGLPSEKGQSQEGPRQPVLLWDRKLPAPCFSTPAVCWATGEMVIGCVDGGLYCLSSSGEQLWVTRRGEKPIFASPSFLRYLPGGEDGPGAQEDESVIIWGCHDGKVLRQDGLNMTWTCDVGRGQPVFASPSFSAVPCKNCGHLCPLVFGCSVPGVISAMRFSDGIIIGEKELPGEVFSSAVVVGHSLVVGCRDNCVYVLDILATCSSCVDDN